jgi:hypothetical protein
MWSRNTLPEANSGHSSGKRIGGNLVPMGEIISTNGILVVKPEENGPV